MSEFVQATASLERARLEEPRQKMVITRYETRVTRDELLLSRHESSAHSATHIP